jgi:hypothetical protein
LTGWSRCPCKILRPASLAALIARRCISPRQALRHLRTTGWRADCLRSGPGRKGSRRIGSAYLRLVAPCSLLPSSRVRRTRPGSVISRSIPPRGGANAGSAVPERRASRLYSSGHSATQNVRFSTGFGGCRAAASASRRLLMRMPVTTTAAKITAKTNSHPQYWVGCRKTRMMCRP